MVFTMDNLQTLRHLFWIVAAMTTPIMLIGIITFFLQLISRPSDDPSSTGLRGIFSSKRVSMFWWFWCFQVYSLNFANPWAWIYLVVVGLLLVAPIFFASVLISHLLAHLTN